MSVLQTTRGKFGTAGEMLAFLWRRKLWSLYPMVFVLLVFGILIAVGSASGVGPFVYTLF